MSAPLRMRVARWLWPQDGEIIKECRTTVAWLLAELPTSHPIHKLLTKYGLDARDWADYVKRFRGGL